MHISVTDFNGCCGAKVWFLNNADRDNKYNAESELKYRAADAKGKYSLALIILNSEQKSALENTLLKIGFKRIGTAVRNVNTGCFLYTYRLNVNTYGMPQKKLKKRTFK